MASMTRCGTCVPPGPSRNAAGCPLTVWDREGNWARMAARSRAGASVSVVDMAIYFYHGWRSRYDSTRLKRLRKNSLASGFREGHEFTRAAKSLKLCSRFSARGELLALSTSFSATSEAVPVRFHLAAWDDCCAREERTYPETHNFGGSTPP